MLRAARRRRRDVVYDGGKHYCAYATKNVRRRGNVSVWLRYRMQWRNGIHVQPNAAGSMYYRHRREYLGNKLIRRHTDPVLYRLGRWQVRMPCDNLILLHGKLPWRLCL